MKEIFKLYREGYGYGYIAGILNEKGYPPPSSRNNVAASGKLTSKGIWNAVAIQRILCNRVYVGDTVQGVSEKVSFKSKKTRRLPSSSWVITTNTHDPIISKEEFEEVRKIRAGKRAKNSPHKGKLHPFRGLLYCGKCGSVLFARERNGRPMGYICGLYAKNGKQSCTSHHINEDVLGDIIKGEVLRILESSRVCSEILEKIHRDDANNIDEERRRIEKLKQQIDQKERQQEALYIDKLEHRISQELFIRMNHSIENRIAALKKELETAHISAEKASAKTNVLEEFIEDIKENGISYEIARSLIDRIIVFEKDELINSESSNTGAIANSRTVSIYFKYSDLY